MNIRFKPSCTSQLFLASHGFLKFYLSLADGADEAGRVVGFPQCSHYLALHKLAARVTASAVDLLVVQCAQIISIFHEESTLCQVATTH